MGVEPLARGQVLRHRLLVEIAGLFPGPVARLQRACTAACRPSPPARCWPTATCSAWASPATATPPPSASASSCTCVRRNVPMIYIIEDNGVYGLTKGQFSATADLGSTLKTGTPNDLPPFDCCALALKMGRHLRGALLQRRQETAPGDPQGGHRAPRALGHRRDFAVRDFQRSRRLHQELRLREGARRGAARAGFCARLSRIFPWRFRKARCATWRCTMARTCASASCTGITIPPTAWSALMALEEAEAKGEVLTGVLYIEHRQAHLHGNAEPGG